MGEVCDRSARDLNENCSFWKQMIRVKKLPFYINSPGGSITAGMAIFDTMQLISSPIAVVVTGMAASMGSILLCGATKGRRLLYPHSRVLIHQPLITGRWLLPYGYKYPSPRNGKTPEKNLMAFLLKLQDSLDKIQQDTDRDFYLNAKEAIEYGLADEIVSEI